MRTALLAAALFFASLVLASGGPTPLVFLPTRHLRAQMPEAVISQQIESHFAMDAYRQIRIQAIFDSAGHPDHLLVHLLSRKTHRVHFARVDTDANYRFLRVIRDYTPEQSDKDQQPGIAASQAKCPDPTVQFIAICPNDDSFEQGITTKVANAAKAHGLKVVQLAVNQATRTQWLNYMSCPNLKGNFYDGDADPNGVTTVDGVLYASDVSSVLRDQWKFQVTNVWVACEAYNDPMLSAMQEEAQSKKYAAGINDLDIGPSDNAAECGMEAAFNGKPMESSFRDCIRQYDDARDDWGFGGKGSDQF